MKRLIEKLSILLCSCMIFYGEDSNAVTVIVFLTALAVSSLGQYLGENKLSLSVQIFYALLCMADPKFFCCVPVILYDILMYRRYYLCVAYGLFFLVNAEIYDVRQIILLAGITLVSVLMQNSSASLEKVSNSLIKIRDSSAEQNIMLAENNKRILENQDYEIHLATLRERNRIAREIHDNVGHMLSRSILQAGALQLINDEDMLREGIAGLSDTLNKAMTEIRQSVHDLHDESVDLNLSLNEALKPLAEMNIHVKKEFDILENIPNNIKFCIISIVKESVSNIIKHSSADMVKVAFREHPAFYQLIVEDNGECSGIISESGIGLANIRERVRNIGGYIDISSTKNGFRIFVTLTRGSRKN